MSNDFPALPYPWQRGEWAQLNRQIDEGQLPHALMLAGPAGIGKRHLATALAQRLLCQSAYQGAACGKCHSCGLLRAQTHPDLAQLRPDEPGKAIKIDSVRELTQILGATAQQGGYKVVLVNPAEAMNPNSANAFLKTLEEPAARTLLILISHTPSSVLPTIRSRCQILSLPMPRYEQAHRWLGPLVSGSDATPETLLELARGAPLKALALLEGDALEQRKQMEQSFLKLCEGQISAIALADQWQKGDVGATLEWLLAWIHDLACWQAGGRDNGPAPAAPHLQALLQRLPGPLLHRYLEKLLSVKRQWLSGANPNKQLLLEELLLDWGVLLRQARKVA